MIRRLILGATLALVASAALAAGSEDALDAQDGFRDAHFGARVESFRGLDLVTAKGAGNTRVYVRAGDELKLGDAVLDGITYGFYTDELYFVALLSSGHRNAQLLLEALQQAYGPGRRLAGDADEFVWQGRRVVLHFREDPATGMGMADLTSLPIDARMKSDREAVPAAAAR
jgi:hypothetical protein